MRGLVCLLALVPGSGCLPEPGTSPAGPPIHLAGPDEPTPMDCDAIAAELARLRRLIIPEGGGNSSDPPDRLPFPDAETHRRYSDLGILYAERCAP